MEKIIFKTDGKCRINATTWPELPINSNDTVIEHVGNCGIGTGMRIPTALEANGSVYTSTTEKLIIMEHKHLKIGHETPKHKLDVKGKLSLKSKLILFYKRYFK